MALPPLRCLLITLAIILPRTASTKMHNLHVFAINELGPVCKTAVQAIVDETNYRSDVLPNYDLKVDFHDGEGQNSVRLGIDYSRQMAKQGFHVSPLSVGFLEEDGGWKRWTAASSFVNMVALRSPQSFAKGLVYSKTAYLTNKTNLRKIGIIFDSGSTSSYERAKLFFHLAERNDFNVQIFDGFRSSPNNSNEDIYRSILDQNIRILSVDISDSAVIARFFCETFQKGITGQRQLFILQSHSSDLLSLPYNISDGCTEDMVVEQMKTTLFIGATVTPADICLTLATNLISVLKETEKALSWNYNMSLKDFSQMPEKVAHETNRAMTDLLLQKEHDNKAVSVSIFSEQQQSFVTVDKIFLAESCCPDNLSLYISEKTQVTFVPPSDSPTYLDKLVVVYSSSFIIIVVLASLSTTYQIAILVKRIMVTRKHFTKPTKMETIYFFAPLISCILLNAGAILLSLESRLITNTVVCSLQPVLITAGISALHGSFAVKLVNELRTLKFSVKRNNADTPYGRKRTWTNSSNRSTGPKQKVSRMPSLEATLSSQSLKREMRHSSYFCVFLALNCIVVVCWLSTHPLQAMEEQISPEGRVYLVATDTYVTEWSVVCKSAVSHSENPIALVVGLLAVLNSLPLIVACKAALKVHHDHHTFIVVIPTEVQRHRVVLFILIPFYTIGVVVAYLVSSSHVILVTVISFMCIFYSLAYSSFIFFDYLKPKRNDENEHPEIIGLPSPLPHSSVSSNIICDLA